MKIRFALGPMVAAFVAGGAVVHCGTTEFAVGGDAGTDGGSGKTHKDAGSSTGSSSGSSGTTDAGSSFRVGRSAGRAGVSDHVLVRAGPYVLPRSRQRKRRREDPRVRAPGDVGLHRDLRGTRGGGMQEPGDICCLFPKLTTQVGACLDATTCVNGSGAQWCDPKVAAACGSGETCEKESCAGLGLNVCSGNAACTPGSGSGIEHRLGVERQELQGCPGLRRSGVLRQPLHVRCHMRNRGVGVP